MQKMLLLFDFIIFTQYSIHRMSRQNGCPCGFDSPKIKSQFMNEVANKCLDKFTNRAEELFKKWSEATDSKLQNLNNKCEKNQTLLSSIKVQIQSHEGMFKIISKFYEDNQKASTNKLNALQENIENRILKFDRQRQQDLQKLMTQIGKLTKNQSNFSKKTQMSQKQKLSQASLKYDIISIEKKFSEFKQRNDIFFAENSIRDKLISSLTQKIKALQSKIFAKDSNKQYQKSSDSHKILALIVKQLRKSQAIKGKCFLFQLGQNNRNPLNKIKGFPSNNRFIIQKTASDKNQYQFVNSVGVSHEECVTYPFRIGKIKESAFIGFITENKIGSAQFSDAKAAYYCSQGTFWIWGEQIESKFETSSFQMGAVLQATIDLAKKRVFWKMAGNILANVKIPEILWNSTFYLAVIIGDSKDQIYIDLQ